MTRQETMERLQALGRPTPVNEAGRIVLRGANLIGAYLEGAYLEGAYLEGANLRGAYLTRANLRGANLTRANLTRAYLIGANLEGANLTRANLEGADLEGANLRGANLRGTKHIRDSHAAASEILRRAAGEDLARLMLAALPLMQRDWCWDRWLTLDLPSDLRAWAIEVLSKDPEWGFQEKVQRVCS